MKGRARPLELVPGAFVAVAREQPQTTANGCLPSPSSGRLEEFRRIVRILPWKTGFPRADPVVALQDGRPIHRSAVVHSSDDARRIRPLRR